MILLRNSQVSLLAGVLLGLCQAVPEAVLVASRVAALLVLPLVDVGSELGVGALAQRHTCMELDRIRHVLVSKAHAQRTAAKVLLVELGDGVGAALRHIADLNGRWRRQRRQLLDRRRQIAAVQLDERIRVRLLVARLREVVLVDRDRTSQTTAPASPRSYPGAGWSRTGCSRRARASGCAACA
ncbi:hypothetical protein DL89DRAFT_116461 [Linderina pennispora]|uniref:ABC transmembrane type-1 domain-containing protein n=1 Tax=Linderina pennispora TaxID=61395 RepID=A0A1Y1VVQ5_9FUNG|nr:uncharacterized protein DL89DRAFT_116461 [Linderina pennispora]ORX65377.1 hypothetical protein DL89DRAFT_116461 [Linderina pennispora]